MTPEQYNREMACGLELHASVQQWMQADDDGEAWDEMCATARAFVAALDELEAR